MEKRNGGRRRFEGLGNLLLASAYFPAAAIRELCRVAIYDTDEFRFKTYPKAEISKDTLSFFGSAVCLNPNPDSATRTKFQPVRHFADMGGVLSVIRDGDQPDGLSVSIFKSPAPHAVAKKSPRPKLPETAFRQVTTYQIVRRHGWESESGSPMFDMTSSNRMDSFATYGLESWEELKERVDNAEMFAANRCDYSYNGSQNTPIDRGTVAAAIRFLESQPLPEL